MKRRAARERERPEERNLEGRAGIVGRGIGGRSKSEERGGVAGGSVRQCEGGKGMEFVLGSGRHCGDLGRSAERVLKGRCTYLSGARTCVHRRDTRVGEFCRCNS